MLFYFLVYFSVFIGFFSFLFNRFHVLNNLLILEFIGVFIYLMMNLYFFNTHVNSFFSLYFVCLLVCESSLGLTLLIIVIYYYSNDYLKNFISLSC